MTGFDPGRRRLLAGAAALLACRTAQAAPAAGARGCCLVGKALPAGALEETSGNPRLDAALGDVLATLARQLAVRPGFAFYHDGLLPNAMALPRSALPSSRGTVLVGLGLLSRVDRSAHGDLFVQAVCAHEFAHIRQYQTGYYDRLNRPDSARLIELHADFLAGYCLGAQPVDYADDALVDLGRAWEDLGDSDFTEREHHGTPEERIAAMEHGFALGRRSTGVEAAAAAGARYLGA